MPTLKLTDAAVQRLKAPPGTRLDHFDTGAPGLVLRISGPTDRNPMGRKTWSLFFRRNGQPTRMTLGTYPAISLAEARLAANKVQVARRRGEDPVADQRQAKATATPDTIEAAVEDYIKRALLDKGRSQAHVVEVRRSFANHVLPRWAGRRLADITRRDVISVTDAVKDSGTTRKVAGQRRRAAGGPTAANHVLGSIRALYNFAIRRGLIETNPAALVELPGQIIRRDRVLNDGELRAVWSGAAALDYPHGPFFQFVLLTAARRTEAAAAQWAEFDLDEGVWTLPAARAKNRKVHIVPLAPAARTLLAGLPRIAGCDYLFTANSLTPLRNHASSKRYIDAAVTKVCGDAAPLAPWTIHDLRRSAATTMARLGTPQFVIARTLNHTDRSVTGIYNRYEYLAEKRTALTAWAEHLVGLTRPPAANVVPLKAVAS